MRLYLDTNIYIDYWEGRHEGIRPLGEFAFQLLKRAIRCEFVIVYSDLVVYEISAHCGMPDAEVFETFFRELQKKNKLEYVKGYNKLVATEIAGRTGIPLPDAVHIVLSKKANAILVSRDQHLLHAEGVGARMPEDF
ncbi:MAG: type II toxin-antitoxin system VapC family toxin [archaeon]